MNTKQIRDIEVQVELVQVDGQIFGHRTEVMRQCQIAQHVPGLCAALHRRDAEIEALKTQLKGFAVAGTKPLRA